MGVEVAFPALSILTAGDRGALELNSLDTEGVLAGGPLILLIRDGCLSIN